MAAKAVGEEMMYLGNIRHLPIADNSIDLIFTDPPYLGEYLYCYEWLAIEAMRVLKPGGFVMAMCGGMYLNKIFRYFDDTGLRYFWNYEIEMPGKQTGAIWHYGQGTRKPITIHHKTILAYSKGISGPRTATTDVFVCNGREKSFHHWGQDVASARYYIDCFSSLGDLVLDPFIGGGTVAIACKLIRRRIISADIDPQALLTTRSRLTNGESAPMINLPMFAALVQ